MALSSVNADDRSYGGERLSSQLSTLSLLFHQLILQIIMWCQHVILTIVIIIIIRPIVINFILIQTLGRLGQLFATGTDKLWFKFSWIQCRQCVWRLLGITVRKVEWCWRFETIVTGFWWFFVIERLCSCVWWTVVACGRRCFTVLLCIVVGGIGGIVV